MRKQPMRRSRGFTLVEIMVVVVVLAILAVTIIPTFTGATHDARTSRAMADIARLENALERFFIHMDRYPTTAERLKALVTPPAEGAKTWRGYLKRLVNDPWDNPYQYRSPGLHGSKTYDLWSRGADGADGGDGVNTDITNWDADQ